MSKHDDLGADLPTPFGDLDAAGGRASVLFRMPGWTVYPRRRIYARSARLGISKNLDPFSERRIGPKELLDQFATASSVVNIFLTSASVMPSLPSNSP